MDVLLIRSGVVENCISADSPDAAQAFYPAHVCIERTGSVGPGWHYDGVTFAPPTPPAPVVLDRHITPFSFLVRFTDSEAVAIDLASQGATAQAAAMRRYQNKINVASWIGLDDAATRGGVQQLESVGLIGAGRAAQILDAPVQPGERPGGI